MNATSTKTITQLRKGDPIIAGAGTFGNGHAVIRTGENNEGVFVTLDNGSTLYPEDWGTEYKVRPIEDDECWQIETGTNSFDGQTVRVIHDADEARIAFLTLHTYLTMTPGIQDAWIDGDRATLHTADDRWVTLTANEEVSDSELETVMDAVRQQFEASALSTADVNQEN